MPSKVLTSSLTSKFAAHFSHSRSSKPQATIDAQTSSSPAPTPVRPSGLSPHAARNASFESGSSTGSKSRSITPRPAKPRITVSLSPDNLDGFQDLFTREVPTTPASETDVSSKAGTQTRRTSGESEKTPAPSPSPRSSPEVSIYRRGHTPASAIAAAVRDRQAASEPSEHSPSLSSKTSLKNSDSDKSNDKHEGSSTPRQTSHRESPRPSAPDRGLPPSIHRRPSTATGSGHPSDIPSSALRSRMKQPTTAARSRPPSMPLPLLPAPSTPPPEVPLLSKFPSTQSTEVEAQSLLLQKPPSRRRANTIGSVGTAPSSPKSTSPTLASRPTTASSYSKPSADAPPVIDIEVLDIENATVEQLRRALRNRNRHLEEMSAYLLKKEQDWSSDRKNLEKKITVLQRDLMRRESEITGLKLIINDDDGMHRPKPLPPGILNHSRMSPMTTSSVDSDPDTRSSALSASRRAYYQSDSGAESQAYSGSESLRASGGSGTESLRSKIRRPFGLSDLTHGISKTGSTRRPSKLSSGSSDKPVPEAPYAKRLSLTSSSSSPSSSTSSLLPPSPSITMSSLSAIPEGSSHLASSRHDSSEQQEERRALRAAHRVSTSSMASSSTAASSGYSVNVKRSRPPSIAQVLEKSPNMDVLEKLRPFP